MECCDYERNYVEKSKITFKNGTTSFIKRKAIEEKCGVELKSTQLISRDILRVGDTKIHRLEVIKIGTSKFISYSEDINCEVAEVEMFSSEEDASKDIMCKIVGRYRWGRCYRLGCANFLEECKSSNGSLWSSASDYFDINKCRDSVINLNMMNDRIRRANKGRYGKDIIERYSSIILNPVNIKTSMYRSLDIKSRADNLSYIQLWSMYKTINSNSVIWIVSNSNKVEVEDAGNSVASVFTDLYTATIEFMVQEEIAKVRGFKEIECKIPDIEDKRECVATESASGKGVKLLKSDEEWEVRSLDIGGEIVDKFKSYIEAERFYVVWIRDNGNRIGCLDEIIKKKTKDTKESKIIKTESKYDKETTHFILEMHKCLESRYQRVRGGNDDYRMKLVSDVAIQRGVGILKDIENEIAKGRHKNKEILAELSHMYYNTVPRDWRQTGGLIDSKNDIDMEYKVLDLYSDIGIFKVVDDSSIINKINYDMYAVKEVEEIEYIRNKVEKSIARNHRFKLEVIKAFRVINHNERFNSKDTNIVKLFHGTSADKIYPILCSRLKLPNHGGMFGPGIYFADKASKSANYSFGYWGGSPTSKGYLFIASVALGKVKEYDTAQNGLKTPPKGYDSVKGCQGKSLYNDEYIVYNEDKVQLEYIVEIRQH